jgi:hypothetical protein
VLWQKGAVDVEPRSLAVNHAYRRRR